MKLILSHIHDTEGPLHTVRVRGNIIQDLNSPDPDQFYNKVLGDSSDNRIYFYALRNGTFFCLGEVYRKSPALKNRYKYLFLFIKDLEKHTEYFTEAHSMNDIINFLVI